MHLISIYLWHVINVKIIELTQIIISITISFFEPVTQARNLILLLINLQLESYLMISLMYFTRFGDSFGFVIVVDFCWFLV